tara:strand:- start:2691 stop:3302 length:612 start_codon:yes stop_codon:yes gene_type:complete
MNKQVLVETQIFQPKGRLLEVKTQGGKTLVEGILATAEVQNGNGRYYSRDIWEREMDKYMEVIKENRALGELDHPESGIINLQNVSHNIKDAKWDGDHIIGTIEILGTPAGNILKELIKAGISVGVSSRGEGSVKQIGEVLEVQDDFNLICWDFVSTPSNPGSYMSPAMLNEALSASKNFDKYSKVDKLIKEILCGKGNCPIF